MDISRSELSEIIALVPQNPFLIAGTIYENICYGLTRTPSSQEVQEAIESSCLSDLSPLFQKVFTPGWLKVEPTFPEVKSKELQLPAFF